MKQILLATALIALPVAAFTGFNRYTSQASVATSASSTGLGDLSTFSAIVTDVQAIAAKGDLVAAKTRIKDFETAWDDQASALRAMDGNAWGSIDDAADATLAALRAGTPDAAEVIATLTALQATLRNPGQTGGNSAAATLISGIAVTDANGRALPCEEMLTALRDGLTSAKLSATDQTAAVALQSKATARCNADDDAHADAFSAEALALVAP